MNFKQLKKDVLNCRTCEALFGFEPHPIFLGNKHSKIVQVSQAPSKKVYETLKPFNDQSGKRLREEWYQIKDEQFYNPNYFYIVSLAHCYPGKDKNGNDKSPPKICYEKWVSKELKLVENEIYIIVGAQAAKVLFPGISFLELVFKDNVYNGKPAYVIPHPSPLNYKWLKDNPEFMEKRMPKIRKVIKNLI